MPALNHSLSRIFNEMASIYKYLGSAERFRALAYGKAARVIDGLKDDVKVYVKNNELEEIPGIGESIGEKIQEYIRTGKISKHEELKKKVPYELMELMNVSGFGPESLRQIHEELDVNTKDELINALADGSVSKLKRFGAKKVENMMRGLKLHKQSEERLLLWDALDLGERIVVELKVLKEVRRIELAGSVRRRKETIGDIDILVSCLPKDRKKIITEFTTLKERKTVLAKGGTKASIIIKDYNKQVDLRIVNENEWGAALLYFTGSREHNVHLRTIAKDKGWKINEYGVFRTKDDKRIAGETEKDVYDSLGFQWIPPELREDKGEIELAIKKKIPRLVELNEIQGDMQMHSKWSDGNMGIEELAKYVIKNYKYDYIVLTDHSKSERIAGGMDEKQFTKQIKEIKAVNKKIGKDFIKTGAEVDILPDGSLDLNDDLLSQLDWVCASIHSGFSKDNTERLIAACRNEYVCCIGHPSGRLLGKREAYKVNWGKVFKVAAETGTALEINAQPDRMDLNDELALQARQAGVKLTISTDSHAAQNYAFMKLGVYIARRAGCRAGDIVNAWSWKEIESFKELKRRMILET